MKGASINFANVIWDADDVLHGRGWVLQRNRDTWFRLTLLILIFGMTYGAIMGTFGCLTFDGWFSERRWQVVYSAVKVPLLLSVTFAICLPSFFVVNTLLGLREDFRRAISALIAGQAAIAIILVSLAPLTALWYASSDDYHQAILFNTMVFGIASLTGQLVLRRNYQSLIMRDARHRKLLYVWIVSYAFVGVQMGWILRPFIGSQEAAVQFLRPEAWDNAYVYVLRILWQAIFG